MDRNDAAHLEGRSKIPIIKSIQDEWAQAGKAVKKTAPPGPNNPLGGYWIGPSFPSYGIHGTNAPLSIYDFQSRGCIRMHPEDAGALFRQVEVGQRSEIIYEPVLLAQLQYGAILLEVHRDPVQKEKRCTAAICPQVGRRQRSRRTYRLGQGHRGKRLASRVVREIATSAPLIIARYCAREKFDRY